MLLNYLLRPDVAAAISQELGYATPNEEAIKLLPEKLRTNPIVFPPEAEFARGEFEADIGEAVLYYEKLWTRLKTGN